MNSIKIAIKNKTKITQRLEKLYDVTYFTKPSLLSKLTFKPIQYPDIYFHQGIINDEALNMIENSKKIIVNSNGVKLKIMDKLSALNKNKIDVVYPYVNNTLAYDKELKKEFKEKFDIDKKTKMIFFQGKDLALSGIKSLLEIFENMHKTNFVVMIESTSKEIQKLKLQVNRTKLPYKVIFFENYKDIDELFIVSDIFILPTQLKLFSQSVLKAMYYKNAVFLMSTNYAAELIDTFSLIQDEYDRSTPFKVDALLINNDELKKIQKENHQKALDYGFESRVDIVTTIIKENFILTN
jgi:hypothetical protein